MHCVFFQGVVFAIPKTQKEGSLHMGLLEEIYHGNIMFTEADIMQNKEYRKWSDKLSALEKKLESGLLPEQSELFSQYSNTFVSMGSVAEWEKFKFGFRVGTLMMIETLTGAEAFLP